MEEADAGSLAARAFVGYPLRKFGIHGIAHYPGITDGEQGGRLDRCFATGQLALLIDWFDGWS